MDFGAMMFATDYAIRPDDLAKLLEDRGFESFWVPEHSPAGDSTSSTNGETIWKATPSPCSRGGRICRNGDDQFIDFTGDGVADYSFTDEDFNERSLLGNLVGHRRDLA